MRILKSASFFIVVALAATADAVAEGAPVVGLRAWVNDETVTMLQDVLAPVSTDHVPENTLADSG